MKFKKPKPINVVLILILCAIVAWPITNIVKGQLDKANDRIVQQYNDLAHICRAISLSESKVTYKEIGKEQYRIDYTDLDETEVWIRLKCYENYTGEAITLSEVKKALDDSKTNEYVILKDYADWYSSHTDGIDNTDIIQDYRSSMLALYVVENKNPEARLSDLSPQQLEELNKKFIDSTDELNLDE